MPSGPEPRDQEITHYNEGMSLRDWFAGMALLGLRANPDGWAEDGAKMAGYAYSDADAMLAAREGAK
jgi:hypothetical protein